MTWTSNQSWLASGGSSAIPGAQRSGQHAGRPAGRPSVAVPAQPVPGQAVADGGQQRQREGHEFEHAHSRSRPGVGAEHRRSRHDGTPRHQRRPGVRYRRSQQPHFPG
jgi:hypothetical protein